jgi:tetratricopeptide (TPR) repeat protein
MGIKIMGSQKSPLNWHRFAQMGCSIGLVIAGLVFPATVNAQSLEAQAEAFSRNCLQQVSQLEGAQSERTPAEIAQALAHCQQAVALTQIVGNRRLAAYNLGNLGTLYLQQQDHQQAITFYQQALRMSETIDDPVLRTKALIALGTVYLQLGQQEQAFSFYQQALANAEANDDPIGTAIAHYNLGLTYDVMGQYQQSVNAYQNAMLIAQEVNDPILETYALSKMKLAQTLIENPEQTTKL